MNFIYFLVNGPSQNEVYGSWYMDEGYVLGLVLSIIVAILAVVLFYYLWSKLKPVTALHWFITMGAAAVATFCVNFFIAKGRIVNYISFNALDQADPTAIQRVAAGTLDMWLYSLNSLILAVIFYFIFSVILKRWSNSYNIPFGVSRKK